MLEFLLVVTGSLFVGIAAIIGLTIYFEEKNNDTK